LFFYKSLFGVLYRVPFTYSFLLFGVKAFTLSVPFGTGFIHQKILSNNLRIFKITPRSIP